MGTTVADMIGAAPVVQISARSTQPGFWGSVRDGTQGVIPRRHLSDPKLMQDASGVVKVVRESPLRVLSLLADLHPWVSQAAWNKLRLAVPTGGVRIQAVAKGTASDENPDVLDEPTKRIGELWEAMPQELGGLEGIQQSMMLWVLFTGMACGEAVPGPSRRGLSAFYPVDSLTIHFGRGAAGGIAPFQRQIGTETPMQELDTERFFWRALDCAIDDPYGRAPFAPALAEILADLALMKDIRDCVHQAAWPRLKFGVNLAETAKIAVDILGMTDSAEVTQWVQEQWQRVVEYAQSIKADDAIVTDTNGTADQIQAANFAGVEPILQWLRQRGVAALKELPILMGITEGGDTQTHTTVQYRIYCSALETIRGVSLYPLLRAAGLHLRLLGIEADVRADLQPIMTSDELADATAEEKKIANAIAKRDEGWITQDQASEEVTGSPAVAEPEPEPPVSPTTGAPQEPAAQDNANAPANEPAQQQAASGEWAALADAMARHGAQIVWRQAGGADPAPDIPPPAQSMTARADDGVVAAWKLEWARKRLATERGEVDDGNA